jgi:hypothetical protein
MKRKPRRKTASKTAFAPAPPQGGARLPLGAHPGNTGGKPGRSGRPPDEFREALALIRDEKGLPVLEDILSGRIRYIPLGVCPQCGYESPHDEPVEIEKRADAADRLRAVDMTLKYTLPTDHRVALGFTLADILTESRKPEAQPSTTHGE